MAVGEGSLASSGLVDGHDRGLAAQGPGCVHSLGGGVPAAADMGDGCGRGRLRVLGRSGAV